MAKRQAKKQTSIVEDKIKIPIPKYEKKPSKPNSILFSRAEMERVIEALEDYAVATGETIGMLTQEIRANRNRIIELENTVEGLLTNARPE